MGLDRRFPSTGGIRLGGDDVGIEQTQPTVPQLQDNAEPQDQEMNAEPPAFENTMEGVNPGPVPGNVPVQRVDPRFQNTRFLPRHPGNQGIPQFNISQRLGESSNVPEHVVQVSVSSDESAVNNQEKVETPELRRLRFLEATQQRLTNQANQETQSQDRSGGLKFSCGTLQSISSEFVLKCFLEQKLNIGALDTVSAEILLKMLKDRYLLNGKTYHAFIASGITNLDLSGYSYLTNDLIRSVSFSSLTQLNVRSGENLTDFALGYIGEISSLKRLILSHCPNFTAAAIGELLKKLPKLELFEAAASKLNSKTFKSLISENFVMEDLLLLDCHQLAWMMPPCFLL